MELDHDSQSLPSLPTARVGTSRPGGPPLDGFDPYDIESLSSLPTARGVAGRPGEPILGRIDQYDILRKLGGGGFGVVYLARDTNSDIEVALKTLHPMLKSNAEEMNLLREKFKLVSRLSHPNIATALVLHLVRELNVWDEAARRELHLSPGDSVMVMRYAPGVTLSKWRRQFADGCVPLPLALEIAGQIASALDYAHGERIVHRDIKPANVMVETLAEESQPSRVKSSKLKVEGSGGESHLGAPQLTTNYSTLTTSKIRVRILDFGLAAEIRSSMSRVSTETGDTSGTRPYMAPEQWLGRKQDGRADQYALACVLYELLSGAPPFAGVFETGDPAIMKDAVVRDAPEEIDCVSPAVNAALQKALSKNLKDRFATCGEFIAAMQNTTALPPHHTTAPSGGAMLPAEPETHYPNTASSHHPVWLSWFVAALVIVAVGVYWFSPTTILHRTAELPNHQVGRGLPAEPIHAVQPVQVAPPKLPEPSKPSGDALASAEIKRLKDDASRKLNGVKDYRDIDDRLFIDRFYEADNAKGWLDFCDGAADLDAAIRHHASVTNSVSWVVMNGPACRDALRLDEAIDALSAQAASAEVFKYAPETQSRAEAARIAARQLRGNGDFIAARNKFNEAKLLLSDAIDEAKTTKAEAERKAKEAAERKAREEAEKKIALARTSIAPPILTAGRITVTSEDGHVGGYRYNVGMDLLEEAERMMGKESFSADDPDAKEGVLSLLLGIKVNGRRNGDGAYNHLLFVAQNHPESRLAVDARKRVEAIVTILNGTFGGNLRSPFENTVRHVPVTGSRAFASDTAPDSAPSNAINSRSNGSWKSVSDGLQKKWFEVDMGMECCVSNITIILHDAPSVVKSIRISGKLFNESVPLDGRQIIKQHSIHFSFIHPVSVSSLRLEFIAFSGKEVEVQKIYVQDASGKIFIPVALPMTDPTSMLSMARSWRRNNGNKFFNDCCRTRHRFVSAL